MDVQAKIDAFHADFRRLRQEIHKVIVGHDDAVEAVLTCLFVGGHALLEGVPGLGKTLLVRTLAQAMDLAFGRVQFTPDLMPADITGTHVFVTEGNRRRLAFQPGPVFCNLLLADEINRATPKTQSALLEAMQEGHVTAGRSRHVLPRPFLVLATQNPIEMEGTYPLAEAQLDRFLFKLVLHAPTEGDVAEILSRTTGPQRPRPEVVAQREVIERGGRLAREVLLAPPIAAYAARLCRATHPQEADATSVTRRYVRHGVSPRGAQALVLGAKVRAVLHGRCHVSFADLETVAPRAMRHRLLLNYDAEADNLSVEEVVQEHLAAVHRERLAALPS